MFKTKYRVVHHESCPEKGWLIQYQKWTWNSSKWRFACGYYPSEEEALACMRSGEGRWMRGCVFTYDDKTEELEAFTLNE